MNRRQLIFSTAIAIPLAAAGGAALILRGGEVKQNLTIKAALQALDRLPVEQIQSTGTWGLAHIFGHCAQSIEFSLQGFPKHHSELFKNTIGSVAFSAFSSAGKMRHDLAEEIPGSLSLSNERNLLDSMQRLRQALIEFDNFSGQVAPHFAYGVLTKSEYEIAHVLHLYNHLEEVVVTGAT